MKFLTRISEEAWLKNERNCESVLQSILVFNTANKCSISQRKMFISYLNEDVERRRWSCPIPLNKDITHSGRDFKVSVYECVYEYQSDR